MKTILRIEGMSCAHCVQHVKEALEEIADVQYAEVNLSGKTAEVEHADNVSLATLKAAVEEEGYEVV